MNQHEQGQVVSSAAEIYDTFFVPALFIDWPVRVLRAANAQPGDVVLDVACGTGALARVAAEWVGASGSVTGIDINEGMLAVAQQKTPHLTWRQGAAESLPFDDQSFDHVMCQFGLMFFKNPERALAEMMRVLRPGGKLAVAVWDTLENTPGYTAVTQMLTDLFGSEVAQSIETPYSMGDKQQLATLFANAGISDVEIMTLLGEARFDSLEAWLYTDIKGWTLADVIDDADFERLRQAAPSYLGRFVKADGSVSFDAPAHIVTAVR